MSERGEACLKEERVYKRADWVAYFRRTGPRDAASLAVAPNLAQGNKRVKKHTTVSAAAIPASAMQRRGRPTLDDGFGKHRHAS
jgi:hypothetical protein